jgi:alpha,alpha-trehalose phosphorylase
MDLHDVQKDTRDGLHIASLAGAWIALVGGFGGMRTHRAPTSFAPQLPEGLTRIAFNVTLRGRWLRVEMTHGKARYVMAEGEPLEIVHHGEQLTVSTGEPQERPIPAAQARARPPQPQSREPARRELKIQ